MNGRIILLAAACFAIAGSLPADQPDEASFEALRFGRKYEEALEYLNAAEKNPATAPAFLEKIPYERGITLINGAKEQKDPEVRSQWLVDGQKSLQKFIAAHKESPLTSQARFQLGNAGVERARIVRKKVDTTAGEAQEELRADLRALYADSQATFESAVSSLSEQLKGFPAGLADPKKLDERDRLRRDYLQAQLLVAATAEEAADTYPKNSLARAKAFTDSANRYEQIYQKYRTRLAGLYARLYQARCEQQLGHHQEAIKLFDELLANPDMPEAFHTLRTKVVIQAVDSWLVEKQYQQVLDRGRPVLDAATDFEQGSSDFVALQVKLASAAKALAEAPKK